MDDEYYKLARLVHKFTSDNLDDVKTILNDYNINYAIPETSSHHKGYTAIHFAVQSKLKESHLSVLLESKASVTCKNQKGFTPVRLAYEVYKKDDGSISGKNQVKICLLLRAQVASGDKSNPSCDEGITHFHIASMLNDVEIVEYFLKANIPVNLAINNDSSTFPGCTSLHLAIINKNKDIIKTLLENKADFMHLNADNLCPLHLINDKQFSDDNSSKRDDILDLLVKPVTKNSNPLVKMGFTQFHQSCLKDKDFSSSPEWNKRRRNLNSPIKSTSPMWSGYTALHFAAHCSLETVIKLLEKGANPFVTDANGVTPLELCFERYNATEISRILKAHNDLKSIRFSNNIVLADVLESLDSLSCLSSSNDVNAALPADSPLWPGFTIFHLVIMFSTSSATDARKCLRHGCDITKQDANGRTALHLAYYMKKMKCINQMFWYHPVTINSVDNNGLSHFYIACIARHSRTIESFLTAGIDLNMQVNIDLEAIGKLDYVPHIPEEYRRIWNPLTPRDHYCLDKNTFIRKGCAAAHIAVVIESKWLIKEVVSREVDPHLGDADGMTWIARAFTCKAFSIYRPLLWKHPRALESNPVAQGGLSHLHIACHSCPAQIVEEILKVTTNVNQQISGEGVGYVKHLPKDISIGDTPLHVSIRSGAAKKIMLLLQKGADASIKNADGQSPLHLALLNNKCSPNVIKRIVGTFDVEDSLDDTGLTRLHIVTRINDLRKMTKLLYDSEEELYCQIKLDSPIWPGMTPLHVSIIEGYPEEDEAVKMLLNRILEIEENKDLDDQPLHDKRKRRKMPKKSNKSYKSIVDSDGVTAFHVSCMGNDAEIVEKFIKLGVDVNASNDAFASRDQAYTPLHFGVKYASDSVIETLLKNEVDVNRQNLTGDTPLHMAASRRPDKVAVFLRTGTFNNDVKNNAGDTALDIIFKNQEVKSSDFVEMFKSGLVTKIDKSYKIQLIVALACRYSANDFKSLIEHVPGLTDLDDHNRNIIHHIVMYPRLSIKDYELARNIDVLTKNGCELDHRDKQGRTPLHHAVLLSRYKKVEVLLMNGADINITDDEKNTPYSYASCQVGTTLLYTLNSHMARLNAAGLYISPVNREASKNLVSNCALPRFDYIKVTTAHTLHDLLKEELMLKFPIMPEHYRREILCYLDEKINSLSKRHYDWLPIFKFQYRCFLERLKLHAPSLASFQSVINSRLPTECCEQILICLNNYDWKNVIQASSEI